MKIEDTVDIVVVILRVMQVSYGLLYSWRHIRSCMWITKFYQILKWLSHLDREICKAKLLHNGLFISSILNFVKDFIDSVLHYFTALLKGMVFVAFNVITL
ncbi:hypothetical protein P8452_47218 [Trifolium repens]|nr:hypothetical protein P8452_47218 [Trifolium repens]